MTIHLQSKHLGMPRIGSWLAATAMLLSCMSGCSREPETLKKDVVRQEQQQQLGFNIETANLVWQGHTVDVAVADYWTYVATEDAGDGIITRYRSTMDVDYTRTFSSATTVDVIDIEASRAGYAVLLKSDSAIDIEGQPYSGEAVFAVFSSCNKLIHAGVVTPIVAGSTYTPLAIALDVDGRLALVGESLGPMDFGNGVSAVGAGLNDNTARPLMAVYDAGGTATFAHGSSAPDHPFGHTFAGVDFDSAGRIVVAGAHRQGGALGPCSGGGIPYSKPHVMKFNADGSCAGTYEWPVSVINEFVHSVTHELAVSQGSIVIRGTLPPFEHIDFGSGPIYGPGTFLARFDESMNLVYAKSMAPLPMDHIAVRDDGHVFISAAFSGTLDMGTGPLVSPGSTTIALSELDAGGTVINSIAVFPTNLEQFPTGLEAYPNNSLLAGRVLLTGRYYTANPWTLDFIVGVTSL